MNSPPILWTRLDGPGHEWAQLEDHPEHWKIRGTAILAEQGIPYRLDYAVECDRSWRTRAVRIRGSSGDSKDQISEIRVDVAADADSRWRVNGELHEAVSGCVDVDLAFTPATNLIPIRRLALPIGKEAKIDVAWLEFPSFSLKRLEQVYRRTDDKAYTFESGGGSFTARLRVNDVGFVTDYPGLWRAVDLERESPRASES